MSQLRPLLVLAGVAVLFAAGVLVRRDAGLEFSIESVQSWMQPLGWRAPALYVGLVTFRFFLLMPSWVVLSAWLF